MEFRSLRIARNPSCPACGTRTITQLIDYDAFCGTPGLHDDAEARVRDLEPAALREEVHAMREKVRQSRPVPEGRFDVKHSAGGMMDAEFAVQLLVLTHSATHEALQANSGNIALLHAAEACGLLPAGVGMAAADAYRELRRAQHRARLDEQATQFDPVELAGAREAVLALWKAVFG